MHQAESKIHISLHGQRQCSITHYPEPFWSWINVFSATGSYSASVHEAQGAGASKWLCYMRATESPFASSTLTCADHMLLQLPLPSSTRAGLRPQPWMIPASFQHMVLAPVYVWHSLFTLLHSALPLAPHWASRTDGGRKGEVTVGNRCVGFRCTPVILHRKNWERGVDYKNVKIST